MWVTKNWLVGMLEVVAQGEFQRTICQAVWVTSAKGEDLDLGRSSQADAAHKGAAPDNVFD